MSSLMQSWPERMVGGLKQTKLSWLAFSPKKSTPTLMFEPNGSYSDVQKTKTKTANRFCFWLPKIWRRQLKKGAGKGSKYARLGMAGTGNILFISVD